MITLLYPVVPRFYESALIHAANFWKIEYAFAISSIRISNTTIIHTMQVGDTGVTFCCVVQLCSTYTSAVYQIS